MTRGASDTVISFVFGALIVALTNPTAAPVIAAATTGAAFDWPTYLSSLDLAMVPEFWASGA